MVCAKCQRVSKDTILATPGIKRKTDMYYGSVASSSVGGSEKQKASPTLGITGISKNKLLSKSAKNPYAAYSGSCTTCSTKTEQGRTYCQRCAYKANACAVCGKSQKKESSVDGTPVIQGQKFSGK